MAKQQAPHRYIYKIHSGRLRSAKWDLKLTIPDARRNDEMIALNDSRVIRWIDEMNGVSGLSESVNDLKQRIKALRREPSTVQNRRNIKALYSELDSLQFIPEYLHLIIDKPSDYHRACRGFKINGITYVRLLGTSGGIKMSTIVFVSDRLVDELRRRIDNGRNADVEQIPAKFEAYRALTCSGSIPVSMPNGILIVPDCETRFREDVVMLNDAGVDEPVMEVMKDYEIVMNASDGFGLMLPSLAERWSQELRLGYVASGFNTRWAWTKGMVFAFDFRAFAQEVAGGYIVKDAWGNDVDVRDVELILTTSMVKLWACYDSAEHFFKCCAENHYTFDIAKISPRVLDDYRALNYQFIQSYDLTDEQIDELIGPTVQEIRDIANGDYRQAMLFLGATNLTEETVEQQLGRTQLLDTLMVNPESFKDPYIQKSLYQLLEGRINRAKIGVVDVHGNYSIVSGDPYALCQSIFGLEVTGLLKEGQLYNRYWADSGAKTVACFRAPMSSHSNIRKMQIAATDEMSYWYQYIKTCSILNAWDTTTAALNGCDFDGDLLFITDNRVLVGNIRPTLTLMCVQRKGSKCKPTEEDLVRANIASFGDDIGRTTNYITSMYDVQARYSRDSEEYRTLDYRIKCGQLFQQNAIDKAKGIACKPMPRSWYDRHSVPRSEDPSDGEIRDREQRLATLADRKPYFMRYIYPDLMKQYNTYIKNTNTKCAMLFRVSVPELLAKPAEELDESQSSFIADYQRHMPVSTADSVMNRICRKVEQALSLDLKKMIRESEFDSRILKQDIGYSSDLSLQVQQLYRQYRASVGEVMVCPIINGDDEDRRRNALEMLKNQFRTDALVICSNAQQLCSVIVDLCYSKKHKIAKRFAWDICGTEILDNLFAAGGSTLTYPARSEQGELNFRGCRYTMVRKECES